VLLPIYLVFIYLNIFKTYLNKYYVIYYFFIYLRQQQRATSSNEQQRPTTNNEHKQLLIHLTSTLTTFLLNKLHHFKTQ